MDELLKIGIVGCGAIGSSLARVIVSEFASSAQLVGLYDAEANKSNQLGSKLNNQKLVVLNLDDLIDKSELVIEATKAGSAFEIAKKCVALSKNIMIMSVGGIIEHYKELEALAREKKAQIFIPSGAICGIDGLKASVFGKIKKVTLTTKKPPRAFSGVPYVLERNINLDDIKDDMVIFQGDAVSAARSFPQNINVASTLSIAGIGPKETQVRIIASPFVTKNTHEVEIESEAGSIRTRTENLVHPDNPKTSYLAVLSAIAVIKQVLSPLKIGT